MKSENKGLQEQFIQNNYSTCRNHGLELCLVRLLRTHSNFETVGALLLSIWKIFHYSLIKPAIYETLSVILALDLLNPVNAGVI